ncbi:MAG: ribosomal-processing cysteine protease Prp [Bacilli bacterium]|nr:ribosomal-processing cysteine protease Prp [Bacilli bacterium]
MTKITVRYQSTGEFISLKSEGHADSAPKGEDLVCAAISGVILGGINALEEKHFQIKVNEKQGNIELCNVGKMNEHDNVVIEVIVSQLQSIARDNPKFMKISVEK